MLEFSLFFAERYYEKLPTKENEFLEFFLWDKSNSLTAGTLKCQSVLETTVHAARNLKRKIEETKNVLKTKRTAVPQPQPVITKDVHTALKDLDLLPQIGNDLACSMCAYTASRKFNLKAVIDIFMFRH